ncbi:MAG: twitching motility protein PilT [Lachnospiraceae bacterium]|nr:twitching motility protein PilT [Lachnospiraceae bacterium]
MVQLIVGRKGKGKTKYLLDKANDAVSTCDGHIVYIDKSTQHMFELNRNIRLIDASRYPLKNGDEFIGFICGIAAQDYDLEQIYLDSFLYNSKVADDSAMIKDYIGQLKAISELCKVDFILSVSKDKEELDPDLYDDIIISL